MTSPSGPSVSVRRVGHESAAVVLGIVREAFGARPPLDPPADALLETTESLATRLALGGGLVARLGGEPVGALLLDPVGDTIYLRRVGVLRRAQGHGIAQALVEAALEFATETAPGCVRLAVVARQELPRTVEFWEHRGFTRVDTRPPYVELVRAVPGRHEVATAEAMRALGVRVAGSLRAGDLLVLTGELGAGKTTFTQGLGAGLGVAGAVTSPTFVIAREHAASSGRPGLVHVDAYRLGDAAELDDLDLDTSMAGAVTVIEWGAGLAEALAESRLEVRISRSSTSGPGDLDLEDRLPRSVEIVGVGPRWAGHRI